MELERTKVYWCNTFHGILPLPLFFYSLSAMIGGKTLHKYAQITHVLFWSAAIDDGNLIFQNLKAFDSVNGPLYMYA